MSLSIQAMTQASRSYADIVDFSDLRKFDAWCRTLGVTRHQLVTAVATVGNRSAAVREYLRQQRSPAPQVRAV